MNAPATIDVAAERPTAIPALIAGARPRAIVPTDLEQIWRFATIVAKSGMAPKDMQKPETITVAIMHGLEVGLTPLMALQRIAVINGRPSIWGDGAMGLVRASGLCEYVYEGITGDDDKMVAVCRVKRKGEKEPIERTFSAADARKAGLWGKAGTWQQYPKRMLQMRARAFALRDLFADVLGGLYIAEELEGMEDERPTKDITPRPHVQPQGPNAQLPPPVAARAEPTEAPAPKAARPLPPLARARTATPADDAIPVFLRREPPPADQPEMFREWIVAHVGQAKSKDELDGIWDAHVAPAIEEGKIIAPDHDDLVAIFARRTTDIANQ